MSGGHGHADAGGNKGVALLISLLALVLAFSETLGKAAQTASLSYNIEASNLWAFYQSKTIRRTSLRIAAEQLALLADSEKARAQIADWKKRRSATRMNPARAKAATSSRRAQKQRNRSATSRRRPTTTTRPLPRPCRSPSCSPRRRSSPRCPPWSGWRARSAWPASLSAWSDSVSRPRCTSSSCFLAAPQHGFTNQADAGLSH